MKRTIALLALALWLLGLLSLSLVALRQPLWGNDFIAIWGLKGHALHRSHELSSLFRVDPVGEFSHPDYPPLWPAILALAADVGGRWDEMPLTVLWPALALAASLLAFRATRGPLEARLMSGAVVSLLPYYRGQVYPGYAEALLAVLVLGAVSDSHDLARTPARVRFILLLSLLCLTKNEGLLLAGVALLTLLVAAARGVLAPRIALAVLSGVLLIGVLPWAVYKHVHLPAVAGTAYSLGSFHLGRTADLVTAMASVLELRQVLWALAGASLLALAGATRRRRLGVLAVVGLSAVALSLSFLFSRFDLAWHLSTTLPRLFFILSVPLVPVLVEAGVEAVSSERPV